MAVGKVPTILVPAIRKAEPPQESLSIIPLVSHWQEPTPGPHSATHLAMEEDVVFQLFWLEVAREKGAGDAVELVNHSAYHVCRALLKRRDS